MKLAKKIFQVLASIWIMFIFGSSLPYKFSGHEHTQYIFTTIGDWLKNFLGEGVGEGFGNYAAYVIGTGELIVTLILLVAVVFTFMKKKTGKLFGLAGLGSFALMSGAVFFHLFSPLGIEVNGDGGSLFRAAVSIMILGLIFAVINRCSLIQIIKKK